MTHATRALACALIVLGLGATGAVGQQVIYSGSNQPQVIVYPGTVAPAPASTITVTTVTTNPPILTSASGVVAGYDPRTNIVTLTDGRMVQLSSKTAILVNGSYPTTPDGLAPGMTVMLSAVNPVVSRDGRTAVLNQGFFDPGNGSPSTWDSKFAGYEADTANAAMQSQAGN